jgi:elongation factor P
LRIDRSGAKVVAASQLRVGMAVRHEGQIYRILAADYHPGQGKMGGVMHARLKNLSTGTFWEHSFRADLKLEDLPVDKRQMEFLYSDSDRCYFMDSDNYEQIDIPKDLIGNQAIFLREGMRAPIEFVEGSPVSVAIPEFIEIRIADTAPPVHAQQDSTWKTALLENGVEIMVPQFIKTGDLIRLDLVNHKYMDRAKETSK